MDIESKVDTLLHGLQDLYDKNPILSVPMAEPLYQLKTLLVYIKNQKLNEAKLQIPKEMHDWVKVLEMGAKKYSPNNWLEPEGNKTSEKEMHDSMFHHLAESFGQYTANKNYGDGDSFIADHESGLDPLLHIACRALMLYTRRQRNILNSKD